ncbi:hypothetical protein BDZ91DRAFT_185616 [Kalaharituber pfeilii]|nr:hypothetical protein BDZ91DRAFT_185616 [Kalaharituber pfeilii]
MTSANIVVIGAGVAGLTTALLLARNTPHKITVVAKHMPGDYDIEYTSPWAGANFVPMSQSGSVAAEWDRVTFKELWRLVTTVPEAGIHIQDAIVYNRLEDANKVSADWFNELLKPDPWFKDIVPEFRQLRPDELPEGVTSGTLWKSVCVNTAIYLPYLVSQCLKLGVVFRRAVLKHISEARSLHHTNSPADLVVNCAGLLASKLGGVEDKNIIPTRGQIVVVRNVAPAMYTISGTDDGEDEVMYIMTRAAGGGTVLGGSYQKGNTESQPDSNLAVRIMKRCIKYCPQLVKPGQGIEGLDVIRHAVGLRPLRIGGPRLEREVLNFEGDKEGLRVVHNYGAGGFGYQSSYGMAEHTIRLVEESLADLKPKARL